MSGLESDTIGGFNSMIEKQKSEPCKAIVSMVLFDSITEILPYNDDIADLGKSSWQTKQAAGY